MRVLLDTHALLWFHLDDPRLCGRARAAIMAPDNAKLVSPASYWEIAIKISIGNYALSVPYEEFVKGAIIDNGFEILSIEPHHTTALVALAFHHKDPFDRLLIAQAMAESVPLISADSKINAYPITRIW